MHEPIKHGNQVTGKSCATPNLNTCNSFATFSLYLTWTFWQMAERGIILLSEFHSRLSVNDNIRYVKKMICVGSHCWEATDRLPEDVLLPVRCPVVLNYYVIGKAFAVRSRWLRQWTLRLGSSFTFPSWSWKWIVLTQLRMITNFFPWKTLARIKGKDTTFKWSVIGF